ncbi:MAG: hypothetical protein PVG39_11965 [Desulfobacteraceae bacterium]|jgi:hypothetical protein
MKKLNLFAIITTTIASLLIIPSYTFADDISADDWVTSGGNTYVSSGNVGIGTTNPQTTFDVNSVSIFRNRIAIGSYGSIPVINSGTAGVWMSPTAGDYGFFMGIADAISGSEKWGVYSNYVGAFNLIMDKNGNVGIGTTSPDAKLDVESTTAYGMIKIQGTGNGYTNANLLLEANDDDTDYRGLGVFMLQDVSDKEWFIGQPYASADSIIISRRTGATSHSGETAQNSNAFLKITSAGNVGIGTTNPTNKLDVNGTIRAKEVKVESNWSDFVFEDDYNLLSINQVESYIKENKHLPDIPSAKEVEEEGLSMAEMMKKQMQKIEELTLYVIEQNKKIENQHNEISVLKQELAKMQKNMN